MKMPRIPENSGAATTSILPENANDYSYLLPTTARFLTEVAFADYHLTVTERTRRAAMVLASAATNSWGDGESFAFSVATDDTPAMLMLMRAAMLCKNGRLTLSHGNPTHQPATIATPLQDARIFKLKQQQRVLSRVELDVFTMRSRLAQAGGGR